MKETNVWEKLEVDFLIKINKMYDYLGPGGFDVFKKRVVRELKEHAESYDDAKKIFENIQSDIYNDGLDYPKGFLMSK